MGFKIAMVCDFFYPQLGGVEFHIYHLAQNLISQGHSVVIITHQYKDRIGVRYLTNGLKVYHVPFWVMCKETTFSTVFSTFPIIRNILIREQIQIIHSHGAVSTLGHEAVFHGNTMGYPTVFTDHSLYAFDTTGAILANKILTFTLTNVDRVICVSNSLKENMILRASLEPERISVIPNAVVAKDFEPIPHEMKLTREKKSITIVVIGRMVGNKGADLLTRLIPLICSRDDRVNFIIAGDGPKFIDFQQMIEANRLEERVQLLGAVPHENFRDVMCQGDIYLHASLTEAFGTVLVEAASCGLLIVTTAVGGIPEVLPPHMTVFAKQTSVSALVSAINKGIELIRTRAVDTSTFHDEVTEMYDWSEVAKRTVSVYEDVYYNISNDEKNWVYMLKRFYRREGLWVRHLHALCCVIDYMLFFIFEWLYPRSEIDIAPKWPSKEKIEKMTNAETFVE
ncbi:phosphatidylinositol N-acetylglucosaminyltransferase SPT14 NDAI_0K01180 [Naumovozyma dairenensis CBS 421]|uniref:Phosphatidylinositol N-acetylglucosaminyltransferase GPI3 subunit n=1 Tax=Naumovozyma dairenensis (strain ATCC 10597 / BCRC 20456 / CBS 421 / NBRC 0211 / NRRL Y-12639) TaxID=1071378 RepID=G0WHP8_NAUDC|nr:hypothetical protein NDAI_0K01180 [Naumovozyma dairenensis CBS 421]CCD27309.1 hypothetical protein NDAI_0K01180 [Naumovozyma dairenensis CBS 421]